MDLYAAAVVSHIVSRRMQKPKSGIIAEDHYYLESVKTICLFLRIVRILRPLVGLRHRLNGAARGVFRS